MALSADAHLVWAFLEHPHLSRVHLSWLEEEESIHKDGGIHSQWSKKTPRRKGRRLYLGQSKEERSQGYLTSSLPPVGSAPGRRKLAAVFASPFSSLAAAASPLHNSLYPVPAPHWVGKSQKVYLLPEFCSPRHNWLALPLRNFHFVVKSLFGWLGKSADGGGNG